MRFSLCRLKKPTQKYIVLMHLISWIHSRGSKTRVSYETQYVSKEPKTSFDTILNKEAGFDCFKE